MTSAPSINRSARKSPVLVAGTLAAVLLVAGSKWASYLGAPAQQVFLTDVLLLLAFVHFIVGRMTGRVAPTKRQRSGALHATEVLVAYAALRFVLGGHYSASALRDLAPYLYASLATLAALSWYASDERTRRGTQALLNAALTFHVFWITVVVLFPALASVMPLSSPGSPVAVFSIRTDADGVLLAVTAARSVRRLLLRTSRARVDVPCLLASLYVLSQLPSRSSLLALLLCLALVIFGVVRAARFQGRQANALLAALPLTCLLLLAALPSTSAGNRLVGAIDPALERQTNSQDSGRGTVDARVRSWGILLDYANDTLPRFAVGVGFGPDYMARSGAERALTGREDLEVRAPHNFLIGSYLRLGVLGLVLALALMSSVASRVYLVAARPARSEVEMLAALIASGFALGAVFGVLLESPFGAVPFYWSLGIIVAATTRQALSTRTSPQESIL